MKQSDIAILILVVSFSLLISFFVGNALFASPEDRSKAVPIIQPISNTLSEVDATIFNKKAINPSENIKVGDSDSQQPFPGESQ
jgi:hypothetical protein